MNCRYECVGPDERVRSLPLGTPYSAHSQRVDSLVKTQKGLALHAYRAHGLHINLTPTSILNVSRLYYMLGLSSWGNFVATISNPCVLIDVSGPMAIPCQFLLSSDVTDVMINAVKMYRIVVGRRQRSAPCDQFHVMCSTNCGKIISKVFSFPSLLNYFAKGRQHCSSNQPPDLARIVLLDVAEQSEDGYAVNDFCLRMRPVERHRGELFVIFDSPLFQRYEVEFAACAGSKPQIKKVLLQSFKFSSPSRLISSQSELLRAFEEELAAGNFGSTATRQRIQELLGGDQQQVAAPHANGTRVPQLVSMRGYFTYCDVNADASAIIATADIDQLVTVFARKSGAQGHDDFYPRFVYKIICATERPYRVVPLTNSTFVVTLQQKVMIINCFTGDVDVIPMSQEEFITGIDVDRNKFVYVAVRQPTQPLSPSEFDDPKRSIHKFCVADLLRRFRPTSSVDGEQEADDVPRLLSEDAGKLCEVFAYSSAESQEAHVSTRLGTIVSAGPRASCSTHSSTLYQTPCSLKVNCSEWIQSIKKDALTKPVVRGAHIDPFGDKMSKPILPRDVHGDEVCSNGHLMSRCTLPLVCQQHHALTMALSAENCNLRGEEEEKEHSDVSLLDIAEVVPCHACTANVRNSAHFLCMWCHEVRCSVCALFAP